MEGVLIYLVSNTRFDHPQVRQLAVCEIKFLKFSLPAQIGALIFTSKNAVAAIKFNEISQIKQGDTIILLAAKVGTTRLIDNIWL